MKLPLIALFSLLLIAGPITRPPLARSMFKTRESKTLSMTGRMTGGTNPRFATGSSLSALVAHPVDPCNGGPIVDTVTLGN